MNCLTKPPETPRLLERALLGTNLKGQPLVLATDSAEIAFSVEEVSDLADDIGLADTGDCPEPGLYLWEGRSKTGSYHTGDGNYEPEVVFEGVVRKVLPEEVAGLYALRPPPDPWESLCVIDDPT